MTWCAKRKIKIIHIADFLIFSLLLVLLYLNIFFDIRTSKFTYCLGGYFNINEFKRFDEN